MAAENDSDSSRERCCFQKWMELQKQDLLELQHAGTLNPADAELSQLTEKAIQHFLAYMEERRNFARQDSSSYFAPEWCSSLEGSLLWVAGCRPSIFIRLVYALSEHEMESRLTEFLMSGRSGGGGDPGWLTSDQLKMVEDLHGRVVKEEDAVSSRFAGVQEDAADEPMVTMAKEASERFELHGEAEKELDDHEKTMAGMLEEADELRLSTLKRVLAILTPMQAVEFLAASKKLHLCLHKWGRERDNKHGRTTSTTSTT